MTMLERIARAITPYVWDEAYGMPESLRDHVRMASLVMARAAVEAMREPEGDILAAMEECENTTVLEVKTLWRAMIAAILCEKTP